MVSYTKTIRFRDTPRDQMALKALNNYEEYGFSSANEMVVSALYKLAGYDTPTNELSPEKLADLIAERLRGTFTINNAPTTTSDTASPVTWDEPNQASDAQLEDVLADILNM